MLEEKAHLAVELFPLSGQDLGGGQLHGGVAVVAAGVHDPRRLGGEGKVRLLLDGKGIDVGPQGNGPAGVRAPQNCHHTGLGGLLNGQAGDAAQML